MLPHTRKPPNNFTRTTGWLLTWPNVALIFRLSKVKKKKNKNRYLVGTVHRSAAVRRVIVVKSVLGGDRERIGVSRR